MGKWIPTILAVLTALSPVITPVIQHTIAVHPALFGGLAGLLALINHWLPSPVASK